MNGYGPRRRTDMADRTLSAARRAVVLYPDPVGRVLANEFLAYGALEWLNPDPVTERALEYILDTKFTESQ